MPKLGTTRSLPLTPYERHARQWTSCTGCSLHQTRRHVVLARGTIPCDVLFVGEAPDQSENVLGQPFVGPAGHLMDSIVERALSYNLCALCGCPRKQLSPGKWTCHNGHVDAATRPVTYAFTNLVACIPLGDDGDKIAQPEAESIEACNPRLQQFVDLASPRLVVAVGTLAAKWLEPGYRHSVALPSGCQFISVIHPAAILRQNSAQQGLSIQRAMVVISNAVEDLT